MAYGLKIHHNVELVASGTRNSDGNTQSTPHVGVSRFSAATFHLAISAASGTSPTLNVYIQKLLPDDSTWMDIGSFTQATDADGDRLMTIVSAGNSEVAITDGTLSANSTVTTTLGEELAVKWVIGGTNPAFIFAVYADFFE